MLKSYSARYESKTFYWLNHPCQTLLRDNSALYIFSSVNTSHVMYINFKYAAVLTFYPNRPIFHAFMSCCTTLSCHKHDTRHERLCKRLGYIISGSD